MKPRVPQTSFVCLGLILRSFRLRRWHREQQQPAAASPEPARPGSTAPQPLIHESTNPPIQRAPSSAPSIQPVPLPPIHESTNPLCGSVNAKQLAQPAFQVGPNRCKSDHGCHFRKLMVGELRVDRRSIGQTIFNQQGSQGVISSARRSAKAEVRGANPRESANSKPLCLQ